MAERSLYRDWSSIALCEDEESDLEILGNSHLEGGATAVWRFLVGFD